MSAITLAGGTITNGSPATVWTGPAYTCSVSLRIINNTASPVSFSYYFNGINRGFAEPIPASGSVDVEKGVKLPAGSTLEVGGASVANALEWSLTGMQNDGFA